jgi:hypothetical protein
MKNRTFTFEVEFEGKKPGTYRKTVSVRSMTLNGAIRKIYQMMPKDFRGIKKILWEE